jgi:hypothetical protein
LSDSGRKWGERKDTDINCPRILTGRQDRYPYPARYSIKQKGQGQGQSERSKQGDLQRHSADYNLGPPHFGEARESSSHLRAVL